KVRSTLPIWSRYEVVGREKHRHRAPREVVNSVNADELYIKGADFLHVAFVVIRPFTTIGPSAVFDRKSTDSKYLCFAVGTVTDVCLEQSKVGAIHYRLFRNCFIR